MRVEPLLQEVTTITFDVLELVSFFGVTVVVVVVTVESTLEEWCCVGTGMGRGTGLLAQEVILFPS